MTLASSSTPLQKNAGWRCRTVAGSLLAPGATSQPRSRATEPLSPPGEGRHQAGGRLPLGAMRHPPEDPVQQPAGKPASDAQRAEAAGNDAEGSHSVVVVVGQCPLRGRQPRGGQRAADRHRRLVHSQLRQRVRAGNPKGDSPPKLCPNTVMLPLRSSTAIRSSCSRSMA